MEPLPTCSIYDYMHANNADRMEQTALSYYGTKITHAEFDEKIDKCARALYANGVRKGNIVSVCMLTCPELLIIFYALNKIGAVANFLVLNATEEELEKQIQFSESRIAFVQDLAVEKIIKASENTVVERIINIPITSSMPTTVRLLADLKKSKRKIKKDVDNWNSFLKDGANINLPEIDVSADDLAVLEYTSGTTGDSKACMLSNLNINSVAWHDLHSQGLFDLRKGQIILSSLPPFLAFGLVTTLVMPLAVGFELILTPDPSPQNTAKLVRKYHPNHIVGGPTHVDAIVKEMTQYKADMSFVVSVCCGGDKLDQAWVDRINNWLMSHGAVHKLINGYGLTETAATFCWESDITPFMIPLYHNNVMVLNNETDEELGYDEEGEICVSGPSVMVGYYQRKDVNCEQFFTYHDVKWMKTGDLGTISENGAFKITGRIKRILWGMGADQIIYRIYPMAIEEVISNCEGCERCAVVGLRNGNLGYLPIAFVVPEESYTENEMTKTITEECRKKLKGNSQPYKIIFLDKLPTTRAGKTDYKELERMAIWEIDNRNIENKNGRTCNKGD